jgi:hypothetical protein
MSGNRQLTFALVDDMAFGAPVDVCAAPIVARELGPLFELSLLVEQGTIDAAHKDAVHKQSGFWLALPARERNCVLEISEAAGWLRFGEQAVPATELTRLANLTKHAAVAAGFDNRTAGMLSAAVGEIAGNIIDHSEAIGTGVVAYQGRNGAFEFVVADQGIGALASLKKSARFATLNDDREALPLTLQHGISRFDEVGRGCGFDMMFQGLANRRGNLRFRSGAAAVLRDGKNQGSIRPKVKGKPYLKGFMASVSVSPSHGPT